MIVTRRDALAAAASAIAAPTLISGAAVPRAPMGVVIHSYAARRFPNPAAFLDHCATLGAAGVQTNIGVRPAAELAALRESSAKSGMYLEGIVALPRDAAGVGRFEAELASARAAGATIVRTVCLSGRRYETFNSAEQYREFAMRSWESLRLAEPIVAKLDMKLAIENHKDWRVDELLGILKRLSSQHIGITLDTGNSIALLEDPMAVVRGYAPFAFTTHIKDMGVAEYDEGFLLAEVPFGEGLLDIREVVSVLRRARPDVRLNVEMMTRDPLRVPCLTSKYWATFEGLPGRHLAETLSMVRGRKNSKPLGTVRQLERAEYVRIEEENVQRCLRYARDSIR